MISSSIANTASVSISSQGKKRLLSLFSAVLTTFSGTRIFGQRESRAEYQKKFNSICYFAFEQVCTYTLTSFYNITHFHSLKNASKVKTRGREVQLYFRLLLSIESFTDKLYRGLACPKLQTGITTQQGSVILF